MKQEIKNLMLTKGRKRSGSALILIVLVVLISMAIGTGLLTMGTNARIASMRCVQDMQARSAADAGIELAVQQINNAVSKNHWSPFVLPTVNNAQLSSTDSYYSVKTAYGVDGYSIESVGTNKTRSRTVGVNLRLKGLFENAVQCRDSIILKSGTVIETVNSDVSLNPGDCDEKAIIGTNSIDSSSITLNNGVTVDGDVVVGVGGDVDSVIKDLGATVDSKYSMSSDVEFPEVDPPWLPSWWTSINVKTGEKTIGGFSGDYPGIAKFSGLKLSNGTKLRVVGNCILHITGDVDMGNSSEIYVEPSASLTVYLDGDWISDNGSSINNSTGKAANFTLYGTGSAGQKIDLKAKSDLFGSIYAPNADLTIYSGGDLFGAFTANNFELKNPAQFYYDTALKTVNVTDEGARFVVSRWHEN